MVSIHKGHPYTGKTNIFTLIPKINVKDDSHSKDEFIFLKK